MTQRKALALSLTLSAASLVACLLLIEGVLRFLPVSSGLRSVPVNAENPIFHFTPNQPFVRSHGWDMHNVVRGRINNAGWVNDQDYVREHPLPLLAVIGDSYIEAQNVSYVDSLQGRLARALQGKARVYSFAAAGAPLSQYLIWAGHAVREWGAKAVVINVVGNDFDESHVGYKTGPGFWLYGPDAAGQLQLQVVDYRPGLLISLARHSALARYLIINLRLNELIFRLKGLSDLVFGGPAAAAPPYAGNTAAEADAARVQASLAAVDAFFRDLPRMVELPRDRVLFTLDGFRYPDAAKAGAGSYFDLMRRRFRDKAQALGYESIDLDEAFRARHRRTGERFEAADDGHWNSNGHAVAAEAVGASRLVGALLK
jgi:hypothetical protein